MAHASLLREETGAAFSIEDFLAAEQKKDLLRFSTAGSVDDGKSTLIGRLLYDSRNVYEDHVRAVTRAQPGADGGTAAIDFAQLTDGLRAEREQGITIDVAYRFFSTARRKFIIADTPGHEQYTRNMTTGASTADLAIILVDARKGILTQSRRHAYIAALLGIPRVVAAINKMDLVDYSRQVFEQLREDFAGLAAQVGLKQFEAIPASALEGDNVVHRSARMPWYRGLSLLEHLEAVEIVREDAGKALRMPVQRVTRSEHTSGKSFRGFAGQIAAGTARVGDRVAALPSGRESRVARIVTFDGDLEEASAPLSVTLTLDDELDISRGDMIAAAQNAPAAATRFEASMVWMDAEPLTTGRRYLLKHTSHTVGARVLAVRRRVNIETLKQETLEQEMLKQETLEQETLEQEPAETLELNGIGVVELETDRPIVADLYSESRATGSFILIDPMTNATAGAGMIRKIVTASAPSRRARVLLAPAARIAELEQRLLELGRAVVRTKVQDSRVWRALDEAGVTVLVESEGPVRHVSPTFIPSMVTNDADDALLAEFDGGRSTQ